MSSFEGAISIPELFNEVNALPLNLGYSSIHHLLLSSILFDSRDSTACPWIITVRSYVLEVGQCGTFQAVALSECSADCFP
jgi:hypothetical protein